jgi:hypothetical protein
MMPAPVAADTTPCTRQGAARRQRLYCQQQLGHVPRAAGQRAAAGRPARVPLYRRTLYRLATSVSPRCSALPSTCTPAALTRKLLPLAPAPLPASVPGLASAAAGFRPSAGGALARRGRWRPRCAPCSTRPGAVAHLSSPGLPGAALSWCPAGGWCSVTPREPWRPPPHRAPAPALVLGCCCRWRCWRGAAPEARPARWPRPWARPAGRSAQAVVR